MKILCIFYFGVLGNDGFVNRVFIVDIVMMLGVGCVVGFLF